MWFVHKQRENVFTSHVHIDASEVTIEMKSFNNCGFCVFLNENLPVYSTPLIIFAPISYSTANTHDVLQQLAKTTDNYLAHIVINNSSSFHPLHCCALARDSCVNCEFSNFRCQPVVLVFVLSKYHVKNVSHTRSLLSHPHALFHAVTQQHQTI